MVAPISQLNPAAALEAATVGWPASVRDRVPVNATVPAVAADEVRAVLARFPGCTTVKVKVAQAGQALRNDVDRVAAASGGARPCIRARCRGRRELVEAPAASP